MSHEVLLLHLIPHVMFCYLGTTFSSGYSYTHCRKINTRDHFEAQTRRNAFGSPDHLSNRTGELVPPTRLCKRTRYRLLRNYPVDATNLGVDRGGNSPTAQFLGSWERHKLRGTTMRIY
ncbi:hypothetical protein EDB81DRAFT_392221 [Dactylonectria macrodidyma]|uniref:Uncharacterized protein n=1 Tax=Dactylonectria macrodidyma TaxID=307937 RepID=A0A9P9F9V4_9HYPO|nr:hypothetical protein EDB81DRAFT_392221 [Dactylonectria macrodidyma]